MTFVHVFVHACTRMHTEMSSSCICASPFFTTLLCTVARANNANTLMAVLVREVKDTYLIIMCTKIMFLPVGKGFICRLTH